MAWLTQKVIDNYINKTRGSWESSFYPDRLAVLRDWVGKAKAIMTEDDLRQVLIYIYTDIQPEPRVVKMLKEGP